MGKPLQVLIIGGGITGPSLAFWLTRIPDCQITIIERAPDLRATGQQIDIRNQAVPVMRRMGIESELRARIVDEGGAEFIDTNGKRIAFFPANKSGKGRQSFSSEYEIMRGDLCNLIYDHSLAAGGGKDGRVKYIFGTSLESYEQQGNSVQVRLSNGSTATYDLVVAADGQGSRTRKMMLGPNAPDPVKSLGLYIAYYTMPKTKNHKSGDKNAKILIAPGARLLFTRDGADPRTMQAYFAVYETADGAKGIADSYKSHDVKVQKRAWADAVRGSGWETDALIDGMMNSKEADDFYFQEVAQVKTSQWSKGRVVLLGDAAYCPSPITGKGTTLGLVGAYVLAGEIAKSLRATEQAGSTDDSSAIDEALRNYDTVLRPLVDKSQGLAPGVPRLLYPYSAWGVYILQWVFWLAAVLKIDQIASALFDDEVKGWDLPDYVELRE